MEKQELEQDLLKTIYPFKQAFDTRTILPILKTRLPISSNIYNMAVLREEANKNDTQFYTFQPKGDSKDVDSVWIVSVYHRFDLGNRYSISVPPIMEITEEVKAAFVNSSVIKWKEPYSFVSLERRISPLITEISAFHYAGCTTIIPTKIYICEPSEVVGQHFESNCDCDHPEKELKLNGLQSDAGAKFLSQNWKYSTARTYEAIKKLLDERESLGVYLNGQLVSGVIINDSGVIGLLHTLKEHRGKGYARLAMTNLMKQIVFKGAFPCSCVEIKNYSSMAFHEKLGMKFSHKADYIDHATPRYQ